MARNLKKYRKIKIGDDVWYWKVKSTYNSYVLYIYTPDEKLNTVYIENHYHDSNGYIVDVSITPGLIRYIIDNDLYHSFVDERYGIKQGKRIDETIIEQYVSSSSRKKKLERILNG